MLIEIFINVMLVYMFYAGAIFIATVCWVHMNGREIATLIALPIAVVAIMQFILILTTPDYEVTSSLIHSAIIICMAVMAACLLWTSARIMLKRRLIKRPVTKKPKKEKKAKFAPFSLCSHPRSLAVAANDANTYVYGRTRQPSPNSTPWIYRTGGI